MDKREKVMKGLECCSIGLYCPDEECPYDKGKEEKQENCVALLALDALELLKEQEQKRGRWTTERTSDHDGEWYCSACGYEPIVMTDDMKFCPGCGAKMTMEGKENDDV